MNIAVLDDYQDVVKGLDCFALLEGHNVKVLSGFESLDDRQELLSNVEAIVLIRERTKINETFLSALPNLKVISQTGKKSTHIDEEACAAHGVQILEGIGSPVAPSELCWSLIMASCRHVVPYSEHLKQGKWQDSGILGLGRCLHGATLGIWGYGKIGQRIARYADAFGMKVWVWGSPSSREKALSDGFFAANSKEAFFSQCDILSLHLRLHDSTRACVTQEDLALMKHDALFVNISRAELVSKGALYRALMSGRPGYAAVDVFEQEPVVKEDPLLALPNVLATPHLGYVEKGSYELYFKAAFENLLVYDQKRTV